MLTTSFANFTHIRKRLRPSMVPTSGAFFKRPPSDNFSHLSKKDELIEGKVSVTHYRYYFHWPSEERPLPRSPRETQSAASEWRRRVERRGVKR